MSPDDRSAVVPVFPTEEGPEAGAEETPPWFTERDVAGPTRPGETELLTATPRPEGR